MGIASIIIRSWSSACFISSTASRFLPLLQASWFSLDAEYDLFSVRYFNAEVTVGYKTVDIQSRPHLSDLGLDEDMSVGALSDRRGSERGPEDCREPSSPKEKQQDPQHTGNLH